jgi:hypothetical protein
MRASDVVSNYLLIVALNGHDCTKFVPVGHVGCQDGVLMTWPTSWFLSPRVTGR